MTQDQIILFALFGTVFAFLLWGRFRYDLVAFTALMAGVVLGVVPTEDAFSGFGHPATLVVALVLVVSAGLVRSGAVLLITRTLIDSSRRLGTHIAIMGGIGGVGFFQFSSASVFKSAQAVEGASIVAPYQAVFLYFAVPMLVGCLLYLFSQDRTD